MKKKKIVDWTVVGLALLGALLITSTNNQVRLIAFYLWVFTNSWLMIYNLKKKEHPSAFLFGAYLVLAIIGIITNS